MNTKKNTKNFEEKFICTTGFSVAYVNLFYTKMDNNWSFTSLSQELRSAPLTLVFSPCPASSAIASQDFWVFGKI